MKKLVIGFTVLGLFSGVYFLVSYLGLISPISLPNQNTVPTLPSNSAMPKNGAGAENVAYRIESFATNLDVPWSIVFTSADRVLVSERDGRVRVVENGVLRDEPLISFTVSTRSEEGLMGLTIDPEYSSNKYVYACYAYVSGNGVADRVVRMVDEGTGLREDKTLLEGIPAAQFHAGCRIKFGPDRKLYITTGDSTQKNLAQDKNSLAGKVLRINSDGSIPSDNPFSGSPIWSYGHRNPQGIDWHPTSGQLWETEHGPSGNDGPGGGDEVNRIEKGGNYGWPIVSHDKSQVGMMSPFVTYTPAIAPGSGSFYTGSVFKQFKHSFLYGGLRGEGIYQAIVSDDGMQVVSKGKLEVIDVGRVRDVVTGPDGYIYFSSSNKDGRGRVRDGDDRIYRLAPKE